MFRVTSIHSQYVSASSSSHHHHRIAASSSPFLLLLFFCAMLLFVSGIILISLLDVVDHPCTPKHKTYIHTYIHTHPFIRSSLRFFWFVSCPSINTMSLVFVYLLIVVSLSFSSLFLFYKFAVSRFFFFATINQYTYLHR